MTEETWISEKLSRNIAKALYILKYPATTKKEWNRRFSKKGKGASFWRSTQGDNIGSTHFSNILYSLADRMWLNRPLLKFNPRIFRYDDNLVDIFMSSKHLNSSNIHRHDNIVRLLAS